MAVPTSFTELSTTPASNPPADTEGVSQGDDQFRAAYAFIRTLYDVVSGQSATTFTPTDGSGAGLTFSAASGRYFKFGKVVIFQASVTYPVTASSASAIIASLPFTSAAQSFPLATVGVLPENGTQARVQASSTQIAIFTSAGSQTTNAQLSGTVFTVSGWYESTT